MSRLPTPGSDDNVWGQILNDFLSVSNNPDGTLQTSAIASAGGYISPSSGIPLADLDNSTQSIINTVASKYTFPAGGIPSSDMSVSVQSSLNAANASVQTVNSKSPSGGNVNLAASDLIDTAIASPTNNQILTYDGGSGKWVNQAPGSGVGLDGNASDIQPLGTRSAGTTGLAADAGHIHTMPRLDQVSNPTSAVALNAQKITGLANGTLATDAAALGQVPTVGAAGSGAANALSANDPTTTNSRSPDGSAGGDLSGSYPDPTVVKLNGAVSVPGTNPASAGLVMTTTGSGTTTSWEAPATAPVQSVFGRSGIVLAQSGDYTAADVGALAATDDLSVIAGANATAGSVSMNGYKITNLANGSLATDAATYGQIPTSLPPGGSAGGDLTGTYPDPTLVGTANVESIISANTTVAGALQKASNLNDVASVSSARMNLKAAAALVPTAVQTTAYSANPSDFIPVDASGGSVTITLPTAPIDETRVAVKLINTSGSNSATISTGGSDVFNKSGGGTNLNLTLLDQGVMLQYAVSGAIWYVQGDDLALSQLDARYPLDTATPGGDLTGTYADPTVAKINGVAISGTPASGDALVATSGSAASWSGVAGTVDWLNVKTQYGAAGNGSTDDTTAIQNALNAANTNGGGTVYLPAGTYKISSELTIYTATVLQGSGPDASIIEQTSTTANGLYALTQRYMAIRDLQITGPSSGSGTGVYLDTSGSAVANCQYSNLLIQHFGTDGIYINTPIASTFDAVRSQNNGQHGFHFKSGTSVSMSACYGAGNTDAGYYFDSMTYCSLMGCAADSNGAGYWLTAGGNITLTGCGCEAPNQSNATYNGYSYVANGGTEFAFIGCYSTGNPIIAYWFTAGTTLGLIQSSREANPVVGATASIQVDTGCTATVIFPSTVTAPNYLGNTNFFNINGVQTYGTGTTSIRVSRGATANYGSMVLSTAGSDQWGFEMLNNSTNDLHIRDSLDAHDMLIGEQHAAVPNIQLLSDSKSFGNGVGVIGIGNANAVPNVDPTGGIILYVDNGVLKWRDPSGNIYDLNVQTTGGVLAVSSGGTGATSLTGLVVGNGTSSLTTVSVPTGNVVGDSDTMTLTNKRITRRVVSVAQSATPAINTDNTDVASITGLAQAITSMTTNLTGTPVDGDMLIIRITDNGSAQAITWGTSFEQSTVPLPATTVASQMLMVGFAWNIVTSAWRCIAVA